MEGLLGDSMGSMGRSIEVGTALSASFTSNSSKSISIIPWVRL